MSGPRTVPLLPCGSIDDAAAFAEALGFEVAYRQGPPHPYVALRTDDGLELHYFEILGFDPATSYGSCLVVVDDPVKVLEQWSVGLGRRYGAVPVRGIPRLMRPRARTSTEEFLGFSVVDVGGNRIRVVRGAEPDDGGDDSGDGVTDPVVVVVERVDPDPRPAPDPQPEAEPVPGSVPEPEPEPAPEPTPEPDAEPELELVEVEVVEDDVAPPPTAALPPRTSAFERHGVAAAPQHRLSALVYLADLALRLGRPADARTHLEAAEAIDPDAPSVREVRERLEA